MNDLLDQKLQALYQENQPDAQFAAQLEAQLRRRAMQAQPAKNALRWVTTVAASFALVVALVATIPPLRSLAEELMQFFVAGSGYTLPGNEAAYADSVIVNTLEEAEAIAGFDALTWGGGGFNTLVMSAAEGYLHITYERENDRGVLMHLTQWRTGSRPDQSPISPDAEVIFTTVNGHDAQFVAGAPFGEEPTWHDNHYRQLRWEAGGFSYHLRVSMPVAETLDEVVAIAESLR